jgi:SagB-type dehydrogenase family enzyme
MKKLIIAIIFTILILMAYYYKPARENPDMTMNKSHVKSNIPVEEAIASRRSERDFLDRALTKDQFFQILWAAQGITGNGKRAVPSAGATYPLEIYSVVGKVEGLDAGVYRYIPENHSISLHQSGDLRKEVASASLNQNFISDAPLVIVIAGEYQRTTKKYGERGIRYVHIEVGHVGQNIYLQAESLGLGTVAVGAFYDEEVARVLNLPEAHEPLYVMPVGYIKEKT